MAYANYIAAVPTDQIDRLRRNDITTLQPTHVDAISHLVAYWINVQPVGRLLGEILDGGERLADNFDHPLRRPLIHSPASVARLRLELRAGLESAIQDGESLKFECFQSDIDRLIAILDVANARSETFVSVLGPPADIERARKVRLPFLLKRPMPNE